MPDVKTHNDGIKQARARAQWELGDDAWADVILHAYLHPDEDRQNLEMEKDDA